MPFFSLQLHASFQCWHIAKAQIGIVSIIRFHDHRTRLSVGYRLIDGQLQKKISQLLFVDHILFIPFVIFAGSSLAAFTFVICAFDSMFCFCFLVADRSPINIASIRSTSAFNDCTTPRIPNIAAANDCNKTILIQFEAICKNNNKTTI